MALLALAGNTIQLVPDGTLLFHLLLVVVMVALLNLTFLRPINRILAERERRTKGRSSEARRALDQLRERLLEYETRTREARAQGYALLDAERSAASSERDRRMVAVKAELMTWLEDEKVALHVHHEEAMKSLAREAGSRAMEIGGQILGRPLGKY